MMFLMNVTFFFFLFIYLFFLLDFCNLVGACGTRDFGDMMHASTELLIFLEA